MSNERNQSFKSMVSLRGGGTFTADQCVFVGWPTVVVADGSGSAATIKNSALSASELARASDNARVEFIRTSASYLPPEAAAEVFDEVKRSGKEGAFTKARQFLGRLGTPERADAILNLLERLG